MTGVDMDDEKQLVIRLREGDGQAFEALYHRHKRKILYNLLRLLQSHELAEELHQEVFLKIWERRSTIDPEKSFGFYLTRIAQNLAMDFYRKASSDEKLREQLLRTASRFYDPEESELSTQRREWLMNAIAKLPPQRQKVFTLCKLEGKSYRYIALLLGVSTGTIKDHMAKASRFLKQEMTKTDLTIIFLISFLTA